MAERRIAVLAAAAVLAGCATATYQPQAVCAVTTAEVRVLDKLPPDGTYKICGSVSTFSPALAEANDSIQAAKDEVKRFGGNAIVITHNSTAASWADGYHRKVAAIVIEVRP
jgi:ABC-type uncharacterized transport system auxiliary subunit